MTFSAGDEVKVLGESAVGKVVRLEANGQVVVEIEGFDYAYAPHQLIPRTQRQEGREPGLVPQKDPLDGLVTAQRPTTDTREVDLHLHHLTRFERGLSDHEKLQMQLQHCREELQVAKQDKVRRVVLIHGKGQFVLRDAVRKLVTGMGLHYEDASYRKYGQGATEVFMR